MRQKTVEKPGWRQPTPPKSQTSRFDAQISDLRSGASHLESHSAGSPSSESVVSNLKFHSAGSPCSKSAADNLTSQISNLGFQILAILLLSMTVWARSDHQQATTPAPTSQPQSHHQPRIIPAPTSLAPSDHPQLPTGASTGAPTLITSTGYRLHHGDKIEVRFFYQPELNQEAVIKPDGTVSLQLIGELRAEGITVPELERQLMQQYSKILVDPVISVVLKEYVQPRVFIGGQVAKPGSYELRDGDMLAQALLLAGGFTPQAHRKQVIHARPVGEGQLRVTVIDATRLFSPNPDPDLNLALKDGDLIYIPESKLSRLSDILNALKLQTFGLVLDPLRRR